MPRGARLSVVVDRPWRAVALAEMITECGLTPRSAAPMRTPRWCARRSSPRLVDDRRRSGHVVRSRRFHRSGCPGPGSCGPGRWPRASRKGTAICSGWTRTHPDTHSPLASALMRVGIAPTLIGTRGSPSGAADQWPQEAVSPGREHRGTAGGCRGVRRSGPEFDRPRRGSRFASRPSGMPNWQLPAG